MKAGWLAAAPDISVWSGMTLPRPYPSVSAPPVIPGIISPLGALLCWSLGWPLPGWCALLRRFLRRFLPGRRALLRRACRLGWPYIPGRFAALGRPHIPGRFTLLGRTCRLGRPYVPGRSALTARSGFRCTSRLFLAVVLTVSRRQNNGTHITMQRAPGR